MERVLGSDDVSVSVWKCQREVAVDFLTGLFNIILHSEKISEEWRSVLVPKFKSKNNMQSCSNCREIKRATE